MTADTDDVFDLAANSIDGYYAYGCLRAGRDTTSTRARVGTSAQVATRLVCDGVISHLPQTWP